MKPRTMSASVNEAFALRVRGLLDYDPLQGTLTWLVNRRGKARAGSRAGRIGSNGYRYISIDGKDYREHRIIWLHVTSRRPPVQIDHVDGNKAHNAWANLRSASPSQNTHNTGALRNNKLGLKGVSKTKGRFRAGIQVSGRRLHLGYFPSAETAHAAYAEAAFKHFGEFANAGTKAAA